MSSLCERVRERLADGEEAAQEQFVVEHLAGCAECAGFRRALAELDRGLGALPQYDAPDDVVRSALHQVAHQPVLPVETAAAPARRLRLLWILAALSAAAAVCANARALGTALQLIESSVGALLMLTGLAAAIVSAGTRNFRRAGVCLSVALMIFVVRAGTSTFFSDYELSAAKFQEQEFNDRRSQAPWIPSQSAAGVSRPAPASAPAAEPFPEQNAQAKNELSKDLVRQGAAGPEALSFGDVAENAPALGAKEEEAQRALDLDGLGAVPRENREADEQGQLAGAGEGAGAGFPVEKVLRAEDSEDAGVQDAKKRAEPPSAPAAEEEGYLAGKAQRDSSGLRSDKTGALSDRLGVGGGNKLPAGKVPEAAANKKADAPPRKPVNQITADIPPGWRAISIDVGSALAVSPDEQVRVLFRRSGGAQQEQQPLVHSARVLSVQALAASSGGPWPEGHTIVTLLVSSEDAQRLQTARAIGTLALERTSAAPTPLPSPTGTPRAREPHASLLRDREISSNLRYQSPHGYWANTYLPGDPHFRELLASISAEDRRALAQRVGAADELDELARRPVQPFDEPTNAALGLYINGVVPSVSGPTRMLLQVGLQASRRQVGSRPPLTMAFLFDLTPGSGVDRPQVEGVLRALLREAQAGDAFSVVVAGREQETVIKPRELRHGTVSVALDELFAPRPSGAPGKALPAALKVAIAGVQGVQDSAAAIGSSAVVLFTGRPLGSEAAELQRLARESGVAGVQVNIVSVGERGSSRELDSIALAGQGTRRVFGSPAEAESIVTKELSAVSSVVARAIRLNIRLAPGVKLIEVFGSRKLDLKGAAQVREAERSIDQRVARTTGIQADRGEDEDGIQVVIPAFYSADAHVVLLDVVVPGAGAVAQVTAKYKDLVFLRNGTAKASLARSSEPRAPGPLEFNVVKNFLGFRLSETLTTAGNLLSQGASDSAFTLLARFNEQLGVIARETPLLSRDDELLQDERMLAQYLAALGGGSSSRGAQPPALALSLLAAGRLKVLPRPMDIQG